MSLSAPISSWWQGGAEKCMTGPCEQVQRADLEPRRRSGPRRAGGNGAELIHGRQPAISRSSFKVRLRGLLATPVDVTYPSVTPCHKVSGISGTSIVEASATCARCLFWAALAVFEPAEKPDYSHASQNKTKAGLAAVPMRPSCKFQQAQLDALQFVVLRLCLCLMRRIL